MAIEAKSRYDAAQSKNAALLEEGRSESKNVDAFEAQRRHNYEMRKAQVYDEMASKQKNIVLSGKAGESLLATLLDFGEKKEGK